MDTDGDGRPDQLTLEVTILNLPDNVIDENDIIAIELDAFDNLRIPSE